MTFGATILINRNPLYTSIFVKWINPIIRTQWVSMIKSQINLKEGESL